MADTELYSRLSTTARAFLSALEPKTPGSNDPDEAAIFAAVSKEEFHLSWGHTFFVSTMPLLQGEKTAESFVQHLLGMAKSLRTWKIDVTSTCVDVNTRSVVVRANFFMSPKDDYGEPLLNDIVFWMEMNQAGEKLVKCTEFVDPVASTELARRMKMGPG